jgi:hypothetical protein
MPKNVNEKSLKVSQSLFEDPTTKRTTTTSTYGHGLADGSISEKLFVCSHSLALCHDIKMVLMFTHLHTNQKLLSQ